MISQAEQVEFMRKELAMREESYPLKVKMGRMTDKEATLGLERTRAVLESLKASNLNNGPMVKAEMHLETVRELEERLRNAVDTRYTKIEPVLTAIYVCAHEHGSTCVHCNSVGQILEEVGFGR